MRLVLDTNIIIGAVMGRGASRGIFHKLDVHGAQLVLCSELLREYEYIFQKPPLRLNWGALKTVLNRIRKISVWVDKIPSLKVVPEDPEDNKLIACAVAGKADYLVSSDKHLLKINEFAKVKIVTPSQMERILKQAPPYRLKIKSETTEQRTKGKSSWASKLINLLKREKFYQK